MKREQNWNIFNSFHKSAIRTSHKHIVESTEWTDKTDKDYAWEFMVILRVWAGVCLKITNARERLENNFLRLRLISADCKHNTLLVVSEWERNIFTQKKFFDKRWIFESKNFSNFFSSLQSIHFFLHICLPDFHNIFSMCVCLHNRLSTTTLSEIYWNLWKF